MGVYYAIMDDKNHRMLNVWKWYGINDFVEAHAPFTVNEILSHKTYECDRCGTDIGFGVNEDFATLIVDFCTEADWSVRVINDSSHEEYFETTYDEYDIDDHGNMIPYVYANNDTLRAMVDKKMYERYRHLHRYYTSCCEQYAVTIIGTHQ